MSITPVSFAGYPAALSTNTPLALELTYRASLSATNSLVPPSIVILVVLGTVDTLPILCPCWLKRISPTPILSVRVSVFIFPVVPEAYPIELFIKIPVDVTPDIEWLFSFVILKVSLSNVAGFTVAI